MKTFSFTLFSVLLGVIAFCGAPMAQADQVDNLISIAGDGRSSLDQRIAAIQMLGEIGDERSLDLLAAKAADSDPQIRFSSIKSLGLIGSDRARSILSELKSDADDDTRKGALLGLAMAKDAQVLNLAELSLGSSNWTERWYAALALDLLGSREAKPLLEKALTDSYQLPDGGRFPVREAAQAALDRLETSIAWSYAFDDGLAKSKLTGKPLLLYFYINGGEWCEQFEKESFTNPEIMNLVKQFEAVRINAFVEQALSEKYQVGGTPAMVVLDSEGNEISKLPGYAQSQRLNEFLNESLAAFQGKGESANWMKVQGLIDEGRYQEAVPLLESYLYGNTGGVYLNKEETAQFMLALAYGKTDEYQKSKDLFSKFLTAYPDSDLTDKALYCFALAELYLKEYQAAQKTLTDLIARFPQSSVIPEAQSLLKQILEVS